MVEYKRAVEEFDPPTCSMEEINISSRLNGDKFFTSSGDESSVNGVGIRFVTTGMYRNVSRVIGGVDIVYTLLIIGLHLLKLITGFHKTSSLHGRAYSTKLEAQRMEGPRRETVAVIIWVGVFAVCILQLLVAAALYTGTRKRDGRMCIRNCRIWCFTSLFLIVVIIFQLLGIFIMGSAEEHIVAVCVYFAELVFRTMAIIFIQSFIKELEAELCDVENGDHVLYYQLCPTPSPNPPHNPLSNNNTVSV